MEWRLSEDLRVVVVVFVGGCYYLLSLEKKKNGGKFFIVNLYGNKIERGFMKTLKEKKENFNLSITIIGNGNVMKYFETKNKN